MEPVDHNHLVTETGSEEQGEEEDAPNVGEEEVSSSSCSEEDVSLLSGLDFLNSQT